ncbi:unnamed protein product [Calypogeia fissa]
MLSPFNQNLQRFSHRFELFYGTANSLLSTFQSSFPVDKDLTAASATRGSLCYALRTRWRSPRIWEFFFLYLRLLIVRARLISISTVLHSPRSLWSCKVDIRSPSIRNSTRDHMLCR